MRFTEPQWALSLRRRRQNRGEGSIASHPEAADSMQVAHDLRRSKRRTLAGVGPTGHPPRALRRHQMNLRSVVRPVSGRACGQRELACSLDTSRCSDMLESPENAETTTVFGLSARWWMRPRRRRTGMQRTHLAAPSGIRTASDQLSSGRRDVAWASTRLLAQLLSSPRTGASTAENFAVSLLGVSVHGSRQANLERLLLCDAPLIRAGSTDGTSLAARITQMVPRMVTEPLNREGARR